MKQILHTAVPFSTVNASFGLMRPLMVAGNFIHLSGTPSTLAWEPVVAYPCSIAGTASNLRVVLETAPGSGKSRIFTVYLNGAATTLTVTITHPATSASDTTHTASVSPGDRVSLYEIGSGGTATFSYGAYMLEFDSGDDFQQSYGVSPCAAQVLPTVLQNYYASLCFTGGVSGLFTATASQRDAISYMPIPGSIKRLDYWHAVGPVGSGLVEIPSGESIVMALVKNGVVQDGSGGTVDTRVTVTTAGSYSWTGTLSIAAGDQMQVRATPSFTHAATNGYPIGWSFRFDATTAHRFWLAASGTPSQVATTWYAAPSSYHNSDTAETLVRGHGSVTTWYLLDLAAWPAAITAPVSFRADVRLNGTSPPGPRVSYGTDLVTGFAEAVVFAVGSAVNPGGTFVTIASGDTFLLRTMLAPAIRGSAVFGTKGTIRGATRAILISLDDNDNELDEDGTLKICGKMVVVGDVDFGGATITGIPAEDTRTVTHDLGGSKSIAVNSSSYVNVPEWTYYVPKAGDIAGATVEAVVEVRTENAGTSVTPKIRDVAGSDAVVGAACTAINTDYSGTNQRQTLAFTPVAGHKYVLMIIGSNTSADIYGNGHVEEYY